MILVVALPIEVVNHGVSLDVGRSRAIFHDDGRPVQVDTVVDDQERVIVVDNIVVDTDTVQVLLQQVLEEEVLLLEGRLLLLDGQLVQVNLVVALVKVVQLLELVVSVRVDTEDLFDHLVGLLLGIWVRLIEGKHLLLLSLELTTKLSRLQDPLTKGLIAFQSFHARKAVGDQSAEMLLLLVSQLGHLLLQIVVVLDNGVFLASKRIVTIIVLTFELLGLESESLSLFLNTVDLLGAFSDICSCLIVVG